MEGKTEEEGDGSCGTGIGTVVDYNIDAGDQIEAPARAASLFRH